HGASPHRPLHARRAGRGTPVPRPIMQLARPARGAAPGRRGVPESGWGMTKWLGITLGILTAIGGFVDGGAVATSGEPGAKVGLGLVWAMLLGTAAIILLVEMSGRFASVAKKPYAAAIREHFGFK